MQPSYSPTEMPLAEVNDFARWKATISPKGFEKKKAACLAYHQNDKKMLSQLKADDYNVWCILWQAHKQRQEKKEKPDG